MDASNPTSNVTGLPAPSSQMNSQSHSQPQPQIHSHIQHVQSQMPVQPSTPSHLGLLPALSPETTPHRASLSGPTPIPGQVSAYPPMAQHMGAPEVATPVRASHALSNHSAPSTHGLPHPHMQRGQRTPQQNVFQAVMGARPGQVPQDDVGGPGSVKVYASAYSQIPVFEAMIRNISVMRRMADSWVNATQILKVAGISKSVRTKILEKQVQSQVHEKVQGGYGKYQGTWIPLDRGREIAQQYGVLPYLAPIFDFVPPPSGPPALPLRTGASTPSAQKTPAVVGPGVIPGSGGSTGRHMSPYAHSGVLPPPPPQFVPQQHQHMSAPDMLQPATPLMYHQGSHMFYNPSLGMHQAQPPHQHQQHQHSHTFHEQQLHQLHPSSMKFANEHRLEPPVDIGTGLQTPISSALAPAATISTNGNGNNIPHGHHHGHLPRPADIYVDQYGQPNIHNSDAVAPLLADQDRPPPIKRARRNTDTSTSFGLPQDRQDAGGAGDEDGDDEDEDMQDRPPIPASFSLATKPFKPKANAQSNRHRQQLLSIFSSQGDIDVRVILEVAPTERPSWDIDMVIDEHGHTALHWACALAKLSVVGQLIELGADINRGNYAGETPLIRSVLTTNHLETGTFELLLDTHLGGSVRTLDHAYRSVIHHIALVAGLKGRAASARGYMASVLEWVAKEQQLATANVLSPVNAGADVMNGAISLKRLVDIQDVHGDTALNVAARVGSKPLVNLLLDAGADKTRSNKLDLKPVDFGVEVEALSISAQDAAVSSLKAEVKRPERRSADVLKNISALFEDVNRTFDSEMESHIESLSGVERSVRTATRSLAERRQQVAGARQRLSVLEQFAERAENARRALADPERDWTGRSPLKNESTLPPAFGLIPPSVASTIPVLKMPSPSDIALPSWGEPGALLRLRRIAAWENRISHLLEERAAEWEGESAERALSYRKVIALCAKVPVDKVDGMLDVLTAAVESDGPALDLTRIAEVINRLPQKTAVIAT